MIKLSIPVDKSEAADAVAAEVVLGIVPVVVVVVVAMMMQCFTRLHENQKKSSGELYCDESRRSS